MEDAAPSPSGNPADRLVMIVDDDEDMRMLTEMKLQKEGFKTVCGTDGLDAFAKFSVKVPDLILLDLMMPRQSGYEFLRHIQSEGHGGIPVFIVTARALDASTVDMLRQEANVVDFFTKPINWPMCFAAIHRKLNTLGKSHRARDL
ncbi:MAG: response regulator [Elusimicrobia bacterium]|nr:response regulator [Elusimicrobiota bacterium]